MTVQFIFFIGIFLAGAVIFVRALIVASRARDTWTTRSVAGTATVVTCREAFGDVAGFNVTVQFNDAHEQPHTVALPGPFTYRPFAVGERVSIRFDPEHPSSVQLSDHFDGARKPIAMIALGAGLMFIGFVGVVTRMGP